MKILDFDVEIVTEVEDGYIYLCENEEDYKKVKKFADEMECYISNCGNGFYVWKGLYFLYDEDMTKGFYNLTH